MTESQSRPAAGWQRSSRAAGIVAAARQILEEEGRDALTMRRIGAAVGIRAPSLYKHFPDKSSVEVALIEIGFEEMADVLSSASGNDGSLAALAASYRGYALAHPHLYRLVTSGPLTRERLRPGVEDRAAAPILAVTGNPDSARACWAFAHGMVILELDGRFPPGADLDAAWTAGISALDRHKTGRPTR
jgi:AcrR family transcriptional regulator